MAALITTGTIIGAITGEKKEPGSDVSGLSFLFCNSLFIVAYHCDPSGSSQ